MKKILFIVGSWRAKSFNRQLAKKAEALLEDKADVFPEQTGVALQPECWSTDVLLLTDEDTQHLTTEAEAFLKKLNA